jgi:hypothetical protein
MQRLKLISACSFLLVWHISFAQTNVKGWHLRDLQKDSFYGISLNKTYDLLNGKKPAPVIVAVIDSGIETVKMMMATVMLMMCMAGIFWVIRMAAT